MKRILTLVFFAVVSMLIAQDAPKFRNVKLMNGDYAVPSENGTVNWRFQSAAFAGELEIVTEDDVKVLKIMPKETAYSKKTKKLRSICMNSSPFRLSAGDTLKYEVEYKGEAGAIIGFIVYSGNRNQWLGSNLKCNGEWQKKTFTMKSKNDMPKSFFAVDVFYKSILLKPVKVSVLKAVK